MAINWTSAAGSARWGKTTRFLRRQCNWPPLLPPVWNYWPTLTMHPQLTVRRVTNRLYRQRAVYGKDRYILVPAIRCTDDWPTRSLDCSDADRQTDRCCGRNTLFREICPLEMRPRPRRRRWQRGGVLDGNDARVRFTTYYFVAIAHLTLFTQTGAHSIWQFRLVHPTQARDRPFNWHRSERLDEGRLIWTDIVYVDRCCNNL